MMSNQKLTIKHKYIKGPSLEADGLITIYNIQTGAIVAQYEGLEVHEQLTELRELITSWRTMADNGFYKVFNQGNTAIGLEQAAADLEKLLDSPYGKGE